MMGQCI